jgi:hypothetical protein
MAIKSKVGTARIEHVPGKPKMTTQGNGQNSRPKARRKLLRKQGKG